MKSEWYSYIMLIPLVLTKKSELRRKQEVADRAVFGLSAGGSMTTTLIQTIPEEFTYAGVSSVGRSFPIESAAASNEDMKNIIASFYSGNLDFRSPNTANLAAELATLGGVSTYTELEGWQRRGGFPPRLSRYHSFIPPC